MKSDKLPSFQFYPGDWRKDPGVQALDYFERGVWHEILCLMHESDQRGKLVLNGKPMPIEALARLLGLDKQILTTTLTTLTTYGVATVEPETGLLICRRMVRDEKLRKTRAECGKLGGNPVLVNQNSTSRVNQNPTPSSSSSSSSSEEERNGEETEKGYHPDARVALHWLNEKAGRHYGETDYNLSTISARLREPEVTIEGVKKMIDRQVLKWGTNPDMEDYLRPATLFGKQKFDGYYGAKDAPISPSADQVRRRGPNI